MLQRDIMLSLDMAAYHWVRSENSHQISTSVNLKAKLKIFFLKKDCRCSFLKIVNWCIIANKALNSVYTLCVVVY